MAALAAGRRDGRHATRFAVAFGGACGFWYQVDRSPAAIVAMSPINLLTLKLNGNAWSRILTAVRDGGLAGMTINVLEQLHDYVKRHVPLVVVGAVDWVASPPLAAGGNAGTRAAAARVRYLGLANVGSLEVTAGMLANAAGVHIVQPITEDLFANLSVAQREALHGRCTRCTDQGGLLEHPLRPLRPLRPLCPLTALTRAKCARGVACPRAPLRPLTALTRAKCARGVACRRAPLRPLLP
jgi:hypothetical protein